MNFNGFFEKISNRVVDNFIINLVFFSVLFLKNLDTFLREAIIKKKNVKFKFEGKEKYCNFIYLFLYLFIVISILLQYYFFDLLKYLFFYFSFWT